VKKWVSTDYFFGTYKKNWKNWGNSWSFSNFWDDQENAFFFFKFFPKEFLKKVLRVY